MDRQIYNQTALEQDMKSRLLLVLLLALGLCTVCSDDSSNPVHENPPDDTTTFSIYCAGDDASAVSQYISASTGGTVEVYSSDSVRFTLTIPDHSLNSSATVTLTPLDTFEVTGPVVTACIDSDSGTGFCFPGILCEPEGLWFDSGAVLAIEFPESRPFAFDSGATIAYFGVRDTNFYACSTVVDQANRRLSCIIDHFSGYATATTPPQDEEDECATLETAYLTEHNIASAHAGTDLFYYSLQRLLDVKQANYRSDPYFTGQGWIPCPSFGGQVDAGIRELISLHWTKLQQIWGGYEVVDLSFSDMIDHYRQMQNLTTQLSGTDAHDIV